MSPKHPLPAATPLQARWYAAFTPRGRNRLSAWVPFPCFSLSWRNPASRPSLLQFRGPVTADNTAHYLLLPATHAESRPLDAQNPVLRNSGGWNWGCLGFVSVFYRCGHISRYCYLHSRIQQGRHITTP